MKLFSCFFTCLSVGLISFSLYGQYEGVNFFSSSSVHEIRFSFQQNNYWDSLLDAYTNDYYIPCDVEIDGQWAGTCGVKFKGNSSFNNPSNKKSFRIDFNEFVSGQTFDGLKKLNLNNGFKDPTFLREKLMLDFLDQIGAYAPRCHYANLYINDQLWGLYTVVDQIDKTWLNRMFGNKDGNLFKGDPNGDLRWMGTNPSNYQNKYELKTNETENDWSGLIAFINTLTNTDASSLDTVLGSALDVENYMKTWATHNLFSNLDSYIGSGHNYYLYFDTFEQRFRFITWDVNEAFGNFSMGMSLQDIVSLPIDYSPDPAGSRPLTEQLLGNANYFQQYKTVICDLLQDEFSIWSMEARIDSLADLIRPHVYADPNKFFPNQVFEDNIESTVTLPGGNPGGPSNSIAGLKPFLTAKRESLASQVASFCTLNLPEDEFSVQVYPNPTSDILTIESVGEMEIQIYNTQGRLIQSQKIFFGKNELSLRSFSRGTYLLFCEGERTPFRIVKN